MFEAVLRSYDRSYIEASETASSPSTQLKVLRSYDRSYIEAPHNPAPNVLHCMVLRSYDRSYIEASPSAWTTSKSLRFCGLTTAATLKLLHVPNEGDINAGFCGLTTAATLKQDAAGSGWSAASVGFCGLTTAATLKQPGKCCTRCGCRMVLRSYDRSYIEAMIEAGAGPRDLAVLRSYDRSYIEACRHQQGAKGIEFRVLRSYDRSYIEAPASPTRARPRSPGSAVLRPQLH